ncbi:hypothetical protein ABW21_db0204306 [Orbilia brochopaga]|nr:hypothetical protein ABW21_db0204306 [Drechslerella brochopaga]
MDISDIEDGLDILLQAINGTEDSPVECNWQKRPFHQTVHNHKGTIQRLGVGSSRRASDKLELSIEQIPVIPRCALWEFDHNTVSGTSSRHSFKLTVSGNYRALCDETILNYPNKPLTFKDIEDTKGRISRGIVKPVHSNYTIENPFHEQILPTYTCGRYYCDPKNDVFVSLCGAEFDKDYPASYTTDLLQVGLDALKESPDRKANCTWGHRWPGKDKDYRINYLVDNRIDGQLRKYRLDPFLAVNKVEMGQTCEDFTRSLNQKSNTSPESIDTSYPDPQPDSFTGRIMTDNTSYVGYIVGSSKDQGGINRTELAALRNSLHGNESLPDIIKLSGFRRPLAFELAIPDPELNEQDCHSFWCFDDVDTNILVSLCGRWFPIAGASRQDSRLSNTALARLTMRSMLNAFICAVDEDSSTPGDTLLPWQEKKQRQPDCKNVKAETVNRDTRDKSSDNSYRGLVRQFKNVDGVVLKNGIELATIERLSKLGHKNCNQWKQAMGINF